MDVNFNERIREHIVINLSKTTSVVDKLVSRYIVLFTKQILTKTFFYTTFKDVFENKNIAWLSE